MKIAFYGSSLLSSYWNGAATYYRGLLRKDLARTRLRDHLLRARRLSTGRSTATSTRRTGADVGRLRRDPNGAARASSPRRRGPTSSSRRAASASSTTSCSTASDRRRAARRAHDLLGRRRARDARGTRAGSAHHPLRNALQPPRRGARPMAAAPPVVEAYRGFGARRCVPIYNALDPATHHPVPRGGALRRATSPSSATACPTAKRASRSSSCGLRPLLPDRGVPARRRRLGGQARCRRTCDGSATSIRATTTPSTARRSPCSTSPATAWPRTAFRRATRVFEAAGAGACLITDAWEGSTCS